MIVDTSGRPIRSASASGSGMLTHAFEAAKSSGYRGFFWFPTLDPAEQMPEWTREQIAKKANWCYNHIGAVRAVIDGLALDEVDTGLWPKPWTTSRAFNAAVKSLWTQQCGFHKSFDSAGENNFYSAQYMIRREIRLRGELFAQKLRPGDGALCPQLHFIPSWQCRNADTRLDQSQWTEGRMNNSRGRAMKWRFVDNKDRGRFSDSSSDDVIHFHDPFLVGQQRGLSTLAPVVRKLFSIDDIERAETSGVLLRTRLAYAIERKDSGSSEGPQILPGTGEVEEVVQDDGSKIFMQKIVASDGSEVDVADLTNGKTIKVIESQKSSESGGWIKTLLYDVALTTGYPPEYVFDHAGMTQGTLVRLVQAKVQRVVNTVRDFQLIMQLLEEWWPFWLWQNIKSGNLDNVQGGIPDNWWSYVVIRPKDITVDPKSEGRLYDERLATGKMPMGLYVGMIYGEDDEEMEDQIIREAYRRRARNAEIAAELNATPLPITDIFRPPTGSTMPINAEPPPAPAQ